VTVNGSTDPNTTNYITKNTGSQNTITWGPTSANPVETVQYSGIQSINIFGGQGNNIIQDPGSHTTIYDGPRANTVTITATNGNGVVINGGPGSSTDNYIIDMGNLLAPVTINSTAGTCMATINAPPGSNVLTLTSTQLTGDGETINFNLGTTITNLSVVGGGTNNQLVVQGSPPGPVTAKNIAPTVGGITAPLDPVAINTAITAGAGFTNLDGSSQTAVWNWGDGTTSTGSVSQAGTSGAVSGGHTYATDGVFTITLTMKDPSGASGTSVFQYEVIYNPNGGFVTGGGWITSPAGAYVANPSLTGKAHFGFNSGYKPGRSVPSGDTEFQFEVANFDFKSTAYDWLTILNNKNMAQYQGNGTINGAGNYNFVLTSVDGDLSGGTDPDTFRIRIWDPNVNPSGMTSNYVYDNYVNAPPGSLYNDPTGTPLGGGEIVIHKSNARAAGAPGANLGQGFVLTPEQVQAIAAAAVARGQKGTAGLQSDPLGTQQATGIESLTPVPNTIPLMAEEALSPSQQLLAARHPSRPGSDFSDTVSTAGNAGNEAMVDRFVRDPIT
jgi:hypothetical protein